MTIGQLREIVSDPAGKFLGDKTLNDILGDSPSNAAVTTKRGPGRPPGKTTAKRAPLSAGEVNTRTKEGRAIYDRNIYDFMVAQGKDGDNFKRISAQEIRREVGGNADQCRKAVNRIIEAKTATWEGKAQATRYFLTDNYEKHVIPTAEEVMAEEAA